MWNWGKDRYWLAVVALVLVMVLVFAGACGGSDEEATATSGAPASSVSSAEGGADGTLLEVIGPEGTVSLTLEQIRALQVTEGYGGMKSSTGRITPPGLMKGVLLEDLFASVGGLPEDMAVSIVAKDGYEMTVSAAQVTAGDFLTYDMVTGAENDPEGPLQVIIAYERDGQPLDPEGEGTLRLAIIGPKKDQVTDGHWWVKWVTKLQVKPIEEEWTLTLSGAVTEEMDRPTFETGANESCHGTGWADTDGNTWTGIPLYLLVGRCDDENVHEGPAYNRELAQAGYDVQLIAADGSSVTVNSTAMYYNKDLIVANKMNGEALPEEYWPLRLVGEGIPTTDMLGGVMEIRALVPTQ
jgi:DMSO/TMAO reductase YedYZ molybdopterin-dependent catalytic subunit